MSLPHWAADQRWICQKLRFWKLPLNQWFGNIWTNKNLVIVDADATPAGGLGIARQAKDEIFNCPPFLALIARSQDAWLATWSRAEAVVPKPLDPFALSDTAAKLLRQRTSLNN
jgi:hypothetical protein